jgi:hypothetical protein
MKNINLRAVGIAAISTVAFSIGAVLPATAQFAPTPPTPPAFPGFGFPAAPTPPTPPTSVRTEILISPTPPRPPVAPTAPRVRQLLLNINGAIRSGNTAQANAFIAQARALLSARR